MFRCRDNEGPISWWCEFGYCVIVNLKDLTGFRNKNFAVGSERHSTTIGPEQITAQVPFELFDVPADRGTTEE